MQTISLPLWQIATAIGVPTLILMMLILRLIRVKRKRQAIATAAIQPVAITPKKFDEYIHQQVLSQQIDAIFNALGAVIEAERIKLKALIAHSLPTGINTNEYFQALPERSPNNKPAVQERNMGQSIADLADEGLRPDDIARKLGISKNEVALAIKMSRGSTEPKRARLEAVA